MKRRVLCFLICLSLLFALAMPAVAAQSWTITVDPINVMVGGKIFLPTDSEGKDVPMFVYNGTTYAPLRALAEAYGLNVGYDAEKRLATVDGTPTANFVGTKGTTQVLTKRTTLTVTPINIEVNGEVFQPKDSDGVDVEVFVYEGTTYAPLRALAETYGLTVGYHSEKRLATVDFDAPAQAPAEQPESTKPIVSEPVDPTWPYFEIDGVKCLAAHSYVAKPGTYNVKLFVDGAQVMRYEEFVVENSSICSATDNGNGTFTLTLKSEGQTDIRVYWYPGDSENGRRSDLGVTCYTDVLSDEPGISLWWHGGTIKDGFGFGVNGQRIFVADVLLDGVRQSDYTVTCDDGKCVCSVQADGSLLIEKSMGGESRITVTCGDLSASFGVMS